MTAVEIATRTSPACPVCASPGHLVYEGLTDRLFGAPGRWNVRKCGNVQCRTLWLDPMPVEADLPKLYTNYYTHQTAEQAAPAGRLRMFSGRVRAAYLHAQYGYDFSARRKSDRLTAKLAFLHPCWRDGLDAHVFYLPPFPGGQLLEIGCGSGEALKSMAEKGWAVTGLDFDEGAVHNARSKGLNVFHGELAQQQFSDNRFDAVVMSHVIEHVPDPAALLRECRRILKPGGTLVALTPNADSSMLRHYQQNWIGLDAPRHVQLFTCESLAGLAGKCGYESARTFTSMNGFVYFEAASSDLKAGRPHVMCAPVPFTRIFRSHLRGLISGWINILQAGKGLELTLLCKK